MLVISGIQIDDLAHGFLRELFKTDMALHVYKYLQAVLVIYVFHFVCPENCFKIIDLVSTSYDFKIKETLHNIWEKSTFNTQVKNSNIKLPSLIVEHNCITF